MSTPEAQDILIPPDRDIDIGNVSLSTTSQGPPISTTTSAVIYGVWPGVISTTQRRHRPPRPLSWASAPKAPMSNRGFRTMEPGKPD